MFLVKNRDFANCVAIKVAKDDYGHEQITDKSGRLLEPTCAVNLCEHAHKLEVEVEAVLLDTKV